MDLAGRDPDEGMTKILYEKGALFLRHLEGTAGRERFDQFLRAYFDAFAFRSITTDDFLAYLTEHLLEHGDEGLAQVPIAAWVRESGLPAGAPAARSDAFSAVERQATGGNTPVAQLETGP